MYSTVITPTETSILHGESMNSMNSPRGVQTSSAISDMLNGGQSLNNFQELQKLAAGQIAIPVKLETGSNIVNDPTLSNYETPLFLSTKQQQIIKNIPKVPMLSPNLVAVSTADAKKIHASLSAAATKKQKMNACMT
jgi:hypothetical protein